MTNQTVRIPLGTSVDGVVNVDDTVSGINLRKAPYSEGEYFGELIEDGVYEFTGVASGSYKVYAGSTELTKVDWVRIGEEGAVLSTGDQTIAGVKTASGQWVFSAGLKTDTISEKTSGSGVTIDGVLIKDSLNGSGIVSTTGNQDISGLKQFNEYPLVDDAVESPTSPRHLTTKDYVDAAVSVVSVTPYQQESKMRRIISGGTVETNKVYTSIPTAISSCGSPDVDNIFDIVLCQGQSVNDVADNVFYLNHSSVTSYCNIRGKGRKTKLVLGGAGQSDSSTKTVTIENCTVYLGANDILTDRTYNSYEFVNCIIYAYKNITFTGCKLYNCQVKQPSTFGVTITGGTSEVEGCTFTNFVTTSLAGLSYSDGLNTNYTMPTDLSLGD